MGMNLIRAHFFFVVVQIKNHGCFEIMKQGERMESGKRFWNAGKWSLFATPWLLLLAMCMLCPALECSEIFVFWW